MKLGILTGYHEWRSYISACEELGIAHEVVDILSPDWMDNIRRSQADGFLCRPPCGFQELKTIYDERLYFIKEYFRKPLYPNFNSLYIYESKRNVAAFLEFYGIPHPQTQVFIDRQQALDHLKTAAYPIVLKSNIGAAGSAVDVVASYRAAKRIARKIFGFKDGLFCRGKSPTLSKWGIPFRLTGSAQKHYLIAQAFHEIKWEWRILKIGNSYFGHQKLLKSGMASGSGLVGWVDPPRELLYMAKDICDKGNFDVMDIDIFETTDGHYLVNELQALFGSYLPYQMRIDDKPGRYVYSHETGFVFEEGEFNRLNSKLLIVQDFVSQLSGTGLLGGERL
ncbi:MAG: hypothetical protein ACXW3H_06355 [Candidatus Aminicenantales bacterium]